MKNGLRQFLIDWNNLFPLDRLYREKFNIAFNSVEHRRLNQIDVKLFFLESHMYNSLEKDYIENKRKLENYQEKGLILKDLPKEKIEDLFDSIDVKNFSRKK